MDNGTEDSDASARDQAIIREFLIKNFDNSHAESLEKTKEVLRQLEEKYSKLEQQLGACKDGGSREKSTIVSTLRNAEDAQKKIEQSLKKSEELEKQVDKMITSTLPLMSNVEETVNQISEAEKLQAYLIVINTVIQISDELKGSLLIDSEHQLVIQYNKLYKLCEELHESSCRHLVRYVNDTVTAWYMFLKEKFTKEFEDLLKAISWPWIHENRELSQPQPTREQLQRLDVLASLMLQINLPEWLDRRASITDDFPPLPLPLQLLLIPLRRRFTYHFSGKRPTNNMSKPEWYFTQVLSWLRSSLPFVDKVMQPCIEKVERHPLKAKVAFTRGLIGCVVEKLHNSVSELVNAGDDITLSHTIDETLLFHREVSEPPISYPMSQPGVLSVITQATCFQRWLHLEKMYATEKMDGILENETAWQEVGSSEENDLKITECAEGFLTLLLTMTDRYKQLPQPGHRIQFLEVQLHLLDDIRVRLLQLVSAETVSPLHVDSSFASILNTIHYIMTVLQEWNELPFFLQLQYLKRKSEGEGDDGVEDAAFDKTLELFECMKSEMLSTLVNYVLMEVKARSRPYRRDKWFSLPPPSNDVSPTVCPMLQALSRDLSTLRYQVSGPCYTIVWQDTAKEINKFIYEEVILENRFNDGGAAQLQYDVNKGVYPVFGEYTNRPHIFFKEVKESCILLTLAKGSALLLREALLGEDVDATKALKEIGVSNIDVRDALRILDSKMSSGLLVD